MNQYTLTIQAKQRPETLERLLRVIRHRGFTILKLNSEHGEYITLQLTVQSEREISLLVHQLVKLPDVISVN
ncbi:acetolactate synthase [Vespertiliibacter pulmonis]|uniref:Acetolactate synthase small subunit n=1 Tax=Vespertiliibacter pulmonis TaxID=1443036 RepID=A0A3N4W2A1_9PAST|nr:acetolactate synthase 2 small subunit [Vespertiliibacter pulmonis]QLB20903.1 acetolactate synthase [Vespertiliibacter pulmonis]RPE83557.1 acetolactate synthase small subunit [Vespertiliibacter pulmonis]